jgi:aspartate carbamoyltransferase catalytic subunit
MNEGVEIAADVANGPQSVISEQVHSGVPIRMAILSLVTSVHVRRAGSPAKGPQ